VWELYFAPLKSIDTLALYKLVYYYYYYYYYEWLACWELRVLVFMYRPLTYLRRLLTLAVLKARCWCVLNGFSINRTGNKTDSKNAPIAK